MTRPRLSALAVALVTLLPCLARAQAVLDLEDRLPYGVRAPPTNAAVENSPFSLALNPAGLALGAGGLAYLHEDDQAALANARRGDGVYLSLGGLEAGESGGAALGLGVEWLRPVGLGCSAANPCLRRTSLGLAFGGPSLSFGAAYRWYSSAESKAVDSLGTLDLGLTARPARWISLGATVVAVNAPQNVPRTGIFSLGLRPFGDRLTLGAEYWFNDDGGLRRGQLSYDADLRLFGFDLLANVAHDVDPAVGPRRVAVGFALRLGFGPAALTGGMGGVTNGQTGVAGDVALELRTAHGPYLFGPPKSARVLDLSDALAGPSRLSQLLGTAEPLDAYTKLALRLQRLADDPGLDTLILKIDGTGDLTFGRVEELRALLANLRARGKHVVAWMAGGGDTGYYLATAAEKIYAAPSAMFEVNGLSSDHLYLRGLLDKLGATPEFVKIGEYKSAPEQFTNTEASPPAAEQTNSMLDDQQTRYVAAIAQARHLSVDAVRKALSRGLFVAEEGVKLGLFDGVTVPGDALDREVAKVAGRPLPVEKLGPSPAAPERWSSLPEIALVLVKGDIVGGDQPGVAAADRIVRELHEVTKDASVKAIVLRVDSPGGDVAASELIYQAVREAAKKKPVIASFGDVAASGGYYVASGSSVIVAEPSTITGSIGVFAGKADLSPLLAKIGVGVETFKRMDHADIFSLTRPWTPDEVKIVDGVVHAFYGTFLQHVADGRKMTVDEVDKIARGRVWTGAQAKDHGLVDVLGGLKEALALAREKAHLPENAPVTVEGAPGQFELPRVVRPTTPQAPGGLAGVTPAEALRLLVEEPGAVRNEALVERAWPLVTALAEGRPLALLVDWPAAR